MWSSDWPNHARTKQTKEIIIKNAKWEGWAQGKKSNHRWGKVGWARKNLCMLLANRVLLFYLSIYLSAGRYAFLNISLSICLTYYFSPKLSTSILQRISLYLSIPPYLSMYLFLSLSPSLRSLCYFVYYSYLTFSSTF